MDVRLAPRTHWRRRPLRGGWPRRYSVFLVALVSTLVLTAGPSAGVQAFTCNGQPATIVGTAEADVITGTPGSDVIAGLGGNDTIRGLGGGDTLCGGAGKDMIFGAGGTDVLSGGGGDDILIGGTGRDTLVGGAGSDKLDGGSGNDELNGGDGADLLIGGKGKDTLRGGRGNDRLEGRGGADTLLGQTGRDVLLGGGGIDVLNGGSGHDTLRGGAGADRLDGGRGNDPLFGGKGDDVQYGGLGSDILYGGDGADTLYGGSGGDKLQGQSGNDELYGGHGRDALNGGGGNDEMRGQAGVDDLRGGPGSDVLWGGTGPDTLRGEGGGDTLWGQEGDDSLLGGAGDDTLSGGPASDICDGGSGDNLGDSSCETMVNVGLAIPGPDFPVGPTNWGALVDIPSPATFTSGSHVVENVRYLKGVVVRGAKTRVTLRNCHVINPGGFWAAYVGEGASLTMEDCQIGSETGNSAENGVGAQNVTLRRVKIVGHEDAIKANSGSYYEQVWITGYRAPAGSIGPHEDGIQDSGGGNWTLRYSRVELPIEPGRSWPTSAVIIKSDLAPIDNVSLENNIFNGGGYTIYSVKGSGYPTPTNVVIRNNWFGRGFGYGLFVEDGNNVVWENNRWLDTDRCVSKSGSTALCE